VRPQDAYMTNVGVQLQYVQHPALFSKATILRSLYASIYLTQGIENDVSATGFQNFGLL